MVKKVVSKKSVAKTSGVKPSAKLSSKTAKPVAKKATAVASKKAPVAKKVVAKASVTSALRPCTKKFTATEILNNVCEAAGIERKQGKAGLDYLTRLIAASIMKGGVGSIKLLGWNFKGVPVAAKKMPAIKKGTMIKNPFNGGKEEPHKGRAAFTKPATMRVKAMALKAIKDMISGAK